MNPTEHSAISRFGPVWILRWSLAIAWAIPIVPLLSVVSYKSVIWSALPLFAAALLVRFGNIALLALRAVDPWIWALLAYTVLSISWSPVPIDSAKDVVQEVGIVLVCIALLARGYSSSWLTSNLRFIVTILLLLSIVVCVALPAYGIDPGYGGGGSRWTRWMGIMDSKNQLGRLSLLCVVLWAFTVRNDTYPVAWRVAIVCLAIVTLFLTDNATSMVVLLGVLLFFVIVRTANRGWMPVWFVALGAMLTISHAVAVHSGYPTPLEFMEQATGLVGRDTSLTGRADLWTYMVSEIMKHPWFGTGYGAGWLGVEADADAGIQYQSNWSPNQGHSSYMDIMLETGVIGLALWAMVIFSHGRRLLALRRVEPDLANFHIALLFCVLLCSCFSTLFYRGPGGPWNIILWVSLIEVCYLSSMYRSLRTRVDYVRHASA